MQRCPSIEFEGSELLEDVSETLVKEDMHFVRLDNGKIRVGGTYRINHELETNLVYQRACVSTDDGGVISLDWPAALDLREEHGLDTTIILVPGTAEGSMEKNLRSFVCECLKQGCFPIVMNPRGCAGSPLTTARLFTAADSDDICTTIQFINRARPSNTLIGVGWGYGANMLTKYLSEVGEKTPLTAAACIDNPFDLEEAIRSSLFRLADQKLTAGLIRILQSNKELFQGRAKGFDVGKALRAKSVRDFEKAVSMVSYGYDDIGKFYASSSTRTVVGSVKIPVLFIHTDGGTVPLFSIPRSSIAENPFTSLLLCSCPRFSMGVKDRSCISWCHCLTIEWLTAVELGLLKGHHPLLEDIDVTVSPSKGLQLIGDAESHGSSRANTRLNLDVVDPSSGRVSIPLKQMLEKASNPWSHSGFESMGQQHDVNGVVEETKSVDPEVVSGGDVNPGKNERGQVQTTQMVINMLDVAMPETLTEELRKKVLAAVSRGENLVTALKDAVPEDVRGKLIDAVSGILHNQRDNLKHNGLISQISDVAPGLKLKIREKVGLSSPDGVEDPYPSDQERVGVVSDSSTNQSNIDEISGDIEWETRIVDCNRPSTSNHDTDVSYSDQRTTDGLVTNHNDANFLREKDATDSESKVNVSDFAKPELSIRFESVSSIMDVISDLKKVESEGVTVVDSEVKALGQEERDGDSSNDQTTVSSTRSEDSFLPPVSSLEFHEMEKEGGGHQKKEEISVQPASNQEHQKMEETSVQPVSNQSSTAGSKAFSVSQALDTLTGIDDSTQVAVNSVFSVIEDVITQLEVSREEAGTKHTCKSKDHEMESDSESHHDVSDMENKENNGSDMRKTLYKSDYAREYSGSRLAEENSLPNAISSQEKHIVESRKEILGHLLDEENGNWEHLVGSKRSFENSNRIALFHNNWRSIPEVVKQYPYEDFLYIACLKKHLLSKIQIGRSLNLVAAALFLDYIPKEGQWKLLDQSGDSKEFVNYVPNDGGVLREGQSNSSSKTEVVDEIIEPAYEIRDAEKETIETGEYGIRDAKDIVVISDETSEDMKMLIRKVIMDSLRVELFRRTDAMKFEETEPYLAAELEHIASVVAVTVVHGNVQGMIGFGKDFSSAKAGSLLAEQIIGAISAAVHDTKYVGRLLPLGVLVGSSLAALRKFFDGAEADFRNQSEGVIVQTKNSNENSQFKVRDKDSNHMSSDGIDQLNSFSGSMDMYQERGESKSLKNGTVMVGAVTAALGASALFVRQQSNEVAGTSPNRSSGKENNLDSSKLEMGTSEKSESNIVASLAEKAMSVARPVVPTKDGEVDLERLVAILADLGQRGGLLRLVGKVALLWGGIRGALSLTDKLISFLRIAERPLLQRIIGFACMVLVLWTPVAVPLLPTLVQNWAAHKSSKFVELACVTGLYASVMALTMLWGKKIRGYGHPLEQYGLMVASSRQMQNFVIGLVGGIMLVLSIHSLNAVLGCVCLSWPAAPSTSDAIALLKVYARAVLFVGQCLVTATCVAIVEELLFRSWLPDEIATDLGYHRGVILSGLAFSLCQRSMWAIPGLWLLSLGLSGARERSQGSLSLPIGLRAGIMASSLIIQKGGILTYQPNFLVWVSSAHPFQPFSGVVGLAVALLCALVLHPKQPTHPGKLTRIIRE